MWPAWVIASRRVHGWPPQRGLTPCLQDLLGDHYEVRNFGIGGATLIKTGRPSIWRNLNAVREFQPHIAIISLGTNDTVGGRRKNWEQIERFEENFTELIGALEDLATKPHIVICTPTAMVLATPGLSEERLADLTVRKTRLQELCARIRKLAANHANQNVSLLELNPVLQDHPELLTKSDGVHPNADGYLKIAEVVATHIRRPAKRPNLVLFLVDDMGWQDTSVPFHAEITDFNRRYHTPNMERLAKAGMKFTQAYACSVCSPTRVSLMTGLNAARHQVTNWTLRRNASNDRRHPQLEFPVWNVNGLSPAPGSSELYTPKPYPCFCGMPATARSTWAKRISARSEHRAVLRQISALSETSPVMLQAVQAAFWERKTSAPRGVRAIASGTCPIWRDTMVKTSS